MLSVACTPRALLQALVLVGLADIIDKTLSARPHSPECVEGVFSEFGHEFIGHSSPVASVVALYNSWRGRRVPPFIREVAHEEARPSVVDGGGGLAGGF